MYTYYVRVNTADERAAVKLLIDAGRVRFCRAMSVPFDIIDAAERPARNKAGCHRYAIIVAGPVPELFADLRVADYPPRPRQGQIARASDLWSRKFNSDTGTWAKATYSESLDAWLPEVSDVQQN
ncbi:hypothetical protein [Burkholderia contaminans]|uniref:hypothetical protein n=1 Tax=Burkholderia contaminans TaxID=488447 RepID=UPI0011B2080C|nr:hypothetical protein [Burkholderia contaminans]